MKISKTSTISLKRAQVLVCIGCCCSRVDLSRSEVPIDELKSLWKDYGLRKKVQLTVSGCLAPCDMHNVALLITNRAQTWLGNLGEKAHFETLAEQAREVIQKGSETSLPEILIPHRFKHWESNEREHTMSGIQFTNTFTPQL